MRLAIFTKLIEAGTKILDKLDEHLLPIAVYANSNPYYNYNFSPNCISSELDGIEEQTCFPPIQKVDTLAIDNKESIFRAIIGYDDIKKEFIKSLNASSPIGILLVGPPGCGKSEFLKQIREAYNDESVFIDGSYGSKAGIFQELFERRPEYLLLDEVDKLGLRDQESLLNLMESGRLTKTTKIESYDIELRCWVFATANSKERIIGPLMDRFETYYLTEYSDDEFVAIAMRRLKQEGTDNEDLALYIAHSVLRGLGRKSLRDVIRIARKCKTLDRVDETIQTLRRYERIQ